MALYDGDVEDRYNRDWLQRRDDNKERTLDQQSNERISRNYVDPETGISATGVSDPETDALWEEKNG